MFRVLLLLACLSISLVAGASARVEDDLSRSIQLAAPAKRIISLTPHATELLFSLGQGERLVAVSAFSDYPAQARSLPVISDPGQAALEQLVAWQPDLIIAWPDSETQRLLPALEALGIAVYVSRPRDISGVVKAVEDLAKLTASSEQAIELLKPFSEQVERLSQQYQNAAKVPVFYQVWDRPLLALGDGFITRLIERCGGENLFAQFPGAPEVSLEAVLALDPPLMLAPDKGFSGDWRTTWQAWPQLQAVQNNQLKTVTADWLSRPTLRSAKALAQLCEIIDGARQGN